MTEKKQYSYYAFISYKREDEHWAKWLQNQLETYHIPSVIRKNNLNVPKKIYPVFRDKTDLTGGKVLNALHKELEESQFLIVICSPKSASSEWVSREIQHFIELGQEDNIIPFIVEGEPFSKDIDRECYPEALKKEMSTELLGISVDEIGKHKAFLRVVATLLNLKFDQLVMRDRKRRKRRRIATAAAVCVAAVLSFAGIWYYVPHCSYYQDFVYQNEVPQGIGKLSYNQRKKSFDCYRIVTQMGRVTRLEHVNSAGTPIMLQQNDFMTENPMIVCFYYEGRRISRAEYRNRHETILLVKDYTSNLKAVDFLQAADSSQTSALSSDQTSLKNTLYTDQGRLPQDSKSEITRHINTYDEHGYLIQVQFMRDNQNTPASDSSGICGMQYERDEKGRVLKIIYLDENGSPRSSRHGVAARTFTYDSTGNLTDVIFLDSAGQPVRGEDRYARYHAEYDAYGNCIQEEYFNENGEPDYNHLGYAKAKARYDGRGFQTLYQVYSPNGTPVAEKEQGVHASEKTYDEHGYITRQIYYDVSMNPVNGKDGYAQVECLFDADGNLKETWYYDADGELTYDNTAICGTRAEYNESGCNTEISFYDTGGQPSTSSSGIASIRREYDENNRLTSERYFAANGNPTHENTGCSSVIWSYDRKGNLIQKNVYDVNQKACVNSSGYHQTVYTYDEKGNQTSISYYDQSLQPAINSSGYHKVVMQYDEKGNCIQEEYYGVDEQLVRLPDKRYAMAKYQYDEYGNTILRAYYNELEKPADCKDGYCTEELQYDAYGNCISNTQYSLQHHTPNGYRTILYTYDTRGNLIEKSFLDDQGNPCYNNKNIAYYVYTYDEKDRRTDTRLYDVNRKLTDVEGYASEQIVYDEKDRYTQVAYFDASGQPCSLDYPAKIIFAYDQRGNEAKRAYLDKEGRLSSDNAYQYAIVAYRYNDRGNRLEEAYYDENEQLCMTQNNYAKASYEYNVFGNVTRIDYYGTDGAPVLTNAGYTAKTTEYDSRGNAVFESYFGTNGQPLPGSKDCPSRTEYQYDSAGSKIKTIYYDSRGKVIEQTSYLIIMQEIIEGSQAERLGIQNDDILIEIGTWNYSEHPNLTSEVLSRLEAILSDGYRPPVDLTFCRKSEGDVYTFYTVHLQGAEQAVIGTRFLDEPCSQRTRDAIEEQYLIWLTKTKEENP